MIARTSSSGRCASIALPFDEPCSGTALPSAMTARIGCSVSTRSISTARFSCNTIRCAVSPVSLRSSRMIGSAASRTPRSATACCPMWSARVVSTQRVVSAPSGQIQPAVHSVWSARCTELFGMRSFLASSPTPAGCVKATSSSTRNAASTVRIPSPTPAV